MCKALCLILEIAFQLDLIGLITLESSLKNDSSGRPVKLDLTLFASFILVL